MTETGKIDARLGVARKALRLIAPERRCESFTTGIGACFRAGRTVDAKYTADRCCDSCIAHDALDRIAGQSGFTSENLVAGMDADSLTLDDAAKLLRRWQLNEWALDKKTTKKALKEQRQIVKELLTKLCRRYIADVEIDHVISGLN